MNSTDDESCSSDIYNENFTNYFIQEEKFDINQEPYYPMNKNFQKKKNVIIQNINEQNIKSNEQKLKFRTELCKMYEINGTCKFGKNCNFAHGKENIRENIFKKSGYKKRICKNFFQKGFCMYGNRCQFSHDLKFDNNLNKDESLNFSYKMLFNKLINTSKENNDEENKKNIMKIKERPRLKVFKKFVKIKKSVYKKKKNYIDEILGNSKKKK